MWTNVFKIGGFQRVSWFQFLPNEIDSKSLHDTGVKVDENDYARFLVVRSHLQLQKEGFLSTWTNSFNGPWDPSQGIYNPDDRIKLWLFLPGRHLTVIGSAQSALSGLRGIASGIWSAPGESEEVSAALSQALRNRIERALSGLGYTRFGDVFLRCQPFSESEVFRRKGQTAIEFIFSASEEAIFVHVLISAKHIRAISMGDAERLLNHSLSHQNLSVIVSPHGMHGYLSGCYPIDFVNQAYLRSLHGERDLKHEIFRGPGYHIRSQTCCVEVTLGSRSPLSGDILNTVSKYHTVESQMDGRADLTGCPDRYSFLGRAFFYPIEAVVIPNLQLCSASACLKRFWMQNWIGPSLFGSSYFMHCADAKGGDKIHEVDISSTKPSGMRPQCYSSSSNSNSSSFSTSTRSSSGSECNTTASSCDLDADADSVTCRQSVLCSSNQFESDHSKLGAKRPRTETIGALDHVGAVPTVPVVYACKSGFGSSEVNSSIITGTAGDAIRSQWDWDDDDKGVGMDIQALLSEFGDFGDFFENDNLPFGEPPGTAESEALMCSTHDCGDHGTSPCTGVMDVPEFLNGGFQSFMSFNSVPPVADECLSKNHDGANSVTCAGEVPPQSSDSDAVHIVAAEALLTFAPEYGAVEAPTNELSSTIFRSPYIPAARKAENQSSKNSFYGPKSPPCIGGSDEMHYSTGNLKDHSLFRVGHGAVSLPVKKYYTCMQVGKKSEKSLNSHAYSTIRANGLILSPGTNICSNPLKLSHGKTESATGLDCLNSSSRPSFASEIESIMFQASICRIRHILGSCNNPGFIEGSILAGATSFSQLPTEVSTLWNSSDDNETTRKGQVPIRISGDTDIIQDRSVTGPVGVWRSVGGMNNLKPSNSPSTDQSSSLQHNSYIEECVVPDKFQQPPNDLLDGLAMLVQQAASFVDVSLDADYGDGVYDLLALLEQQQRSFCCSPSRLHAGCGGILASCHSFDISGLGLYDPFAADILPSTVISLLHSEIRTGLKFAFNILDGPLSIVDWCEGHSQSGDMASTMDVYSIELDECESKNFSCATKISMGEPLSPPQSLAGGSSSLSGSCNIDGMRVDEACQRKSLPTLTSSELDQQLDSHFRPCSIVLPEPAILVGYQDDWIKTSTSSLQLWEKAPLEPYALHKPVTYCVICPDIDHLTSAATDFFQQLGSVYEMCNLGTHLPQNLGNEDGDSAKVPTGFLLLDCPQSVKIESNNASLVASISDYFLSLSNGWDVSSFLMSLSRVLKALKLSSWLMSNTKDGNRSSTIVIYVVCPYPEALAVLQTVVKASVSLGSAFLSNDRERHSVSYASVGKALGSASATDETVNLITLSGFSIPRLVLQIVTVDAIFRINRPSLNELVLLKEMAFTVYNKARHVPRWMSNDPSQNTSASPAQGIWKDYSSSRQATQRTSSGVHHMFEPLFILAEPGSVDRGSALGVDTAQLDVVESEGSVSTSQKSSTSIHCCYGWTDDWRWMICVWTDARGELLDTHVFPFGGISSRQDTKGLQCLFVHVLQQGSHILQSCCSTESGAINPRDFIIARIGSFYDLECQEWHKALSDLKKWPLQLRSFPHSKPSSGFTMTRGLFHWIRTITLVTVSIDHTLQLVVPADPSSGSGYVEGFTAVGSLGSVSASYILIPSPSMRFLTHPPLQLPTCLNAKSPPLAHLLHSKGSSVPLSTGFVVSKGVARGERCGGKEWPSVLLVGLVDYYGDVGLLPRWVMRTAESGDKVVWTRVLLENAAAELHALSWMTASPAYMERRTPLPVHCDMVLRLRRLLHFADTTLSGQGGKAPPTSK